MRSIKDALNRHPDSSGLCGIWAVLTAVIAVLAALTTASIRV